MIDFEQKTHVKPIRCRRDKPHFYVFQLDDGRTIFNSSNVFPEDKPTQIYMGKLFSAKNLDQIRRLLWPNQY